MKSVLFYNKKRIDVEVVNSINIVEAVEKDINFYDYDGFRLLSYTNAEALELTELPANPADNENLTFDGWNWTLAAIKSQINNVGGVVNVGAIYHTTDENTHITCKPTKTYPQVYICLTPTVANAVTVDWGDGNTDTWTTASQVNKTHTYTGITDTSVFDITIYCTSGTYSFSTYITEFEAINKNCVYTDIKLSNKVTSLGNNCFSGCSSLQSITIPSSVTYLGQNCFQNCYSLQSIVISSGITGVSLNCFRNCYSLQSIVISSGFRGLGIQNFFNCRALQRITIPSGVTRLDLLFQGCYSLQSITIPSGVTYLEQECFQDCYSLQSINIPSSVTSLGNNCLKYCISLKKIYMQPITPPTLSSTDSIQNNENLVIYVPTGSLLSYQGADNWSNFASKMVEYSI